MTTEFTKAQLSTILRAIDDQPRNPNTRAAALKSIGRSAERFGITTDDVLAAAPGLLDGRLGPADFRAELHDLSEDAASKAATDTAAAEEAADANVAGPPTEPGKRGPRPGTKQALLIDLLHRPEGATVDQIAEHTRWQAHTIRGVISGALKKKLGLTVEATRVRNVGPNRTGAKRSTTVYRIVQ